MRTLASASPRQSCRAPISLHRLVQGSETRSKDLWGARIQRRKALPSASINVINAFRHGPAILPRTKSPRQPAQPLNSPLTLRGMVVNPLTGYPLQGLTVRSCFLEPPAKARGKQKETLLCSGISDEAGAYQLSWLNSPANNRLARRGIFDGAYIPSSRAKHVAEVIGASALSMIRRSRPVVLQL